MSIKICTFFLLLALALLSPASVAAQTDATGQTEPSLLTPAGLTSAAKKIFTIATQGALPLDLEERDRLDELAGVERLTDDNISKLVGGGGEDEVWVVIVHGPKTEPVTPPYLEAHANATALACKAIEEDAETETDLTKVHWARLDFVTEWKTCARWLTMRPPWIVLLSSAGKEIRFIHPRSLPASGEKLYEVISSGQWQNVPVWQSPYQPGGERAWIVETYLKTIGQTSKLTSRVPHWVLVLVSGGIGQALLRWLHGPERAAPATADTASEGAPTQPVGEKGTPKGVEIETVLTAKEGPASPRKRRGKKVA